MKTFLYIKLFLFMIALTVSCKKDLDTKPQDEFSDIDTWNDPALIEAFLNGIYRGIDNPADGGDGLLKAEFVDEMHDQWYSFFEFNNSLLTSDNLASWAHEDWNSLYNSIRSCNLFLEKIETAPLEDIIVDDKTLTERMTGEAVFLRAYFYHQLTSLYGGVPLVVKSYQLTDDFSVKRDTYADCIQFISDELDKAAALLPIVQSGGNSGRATRGAALALKSRTLLYAASALHANNPVFSGYSNPELLGYTDGNREQQWEAARDAAKAVIDMGTYGLFKANPATGDSIAQNLVDIFLTKNTEEDIFVRYYVAKSGENNLPLASGPNGYHLYGEDTPSGELVDDFEMADGTPFDWNDPTKATEPYRNRDPRFYAAILYEGVKFKPRPADVVILDPVGVIQVGTWQKWNSATNSMVEVQGLDSRRSPIEDFNGGYTGYYLRKFIDPAADGQFSGQDVPWRYIRYAEILLNYAEACIELNQDAEARIYLNMIRKRAGMPDIIESGNALKARYRNERRVELAFEDHRFYDVRRWLIAPEAYRQFSGVNVLYKLNPDKTTATIPEIKPIVVQNSAWVNKAYFFPVMRDEMNKNAMLIQNPDY